MMVLRAEGATILIGVHRRSSAVSFPSFFVSFVVTPFLADRRVAPEKPDAARRPTRYKSSKRHDRRPAA
jgi:hypothetical protein